MSLKQVRCPACKDHPGLGANRDGVCQVCAGAEKIYVPGPPDQIAATGMNWQPIINAVRDLLILIITTLAAYFASQADTKSDKAAVQSEKNGVAVEEVRRDVGAVKEYQARRPPVFSPDGK